VAITFYDFAFCSTDAGFSRKVQILLSPQKSFPETEGIFCLSIFISHNTHHSFPNYYIQKSPESFETGLLACI
jgi:hypothetical protein